MNKIVAGIDVGKQDLVVSVARGPVRRFPNTGAGLTAVLAWVREQAVTHVVCEATGGYERGLVQRVRTTELSVVVAHPTKVRAFAQAVGQGAKTDPLDAQILAHYGKVFDLPVEAAQEEASEEVRALLGRRQQLLDQRTQELNRLEKGLRGRVKQSCQRHLAWLDKELKHLEDEYQQALQARPELGRARGLVSECVRGGGAHLRHVAGVCAGIGPRLREGADGLGRGVCHGRRTVGPTGGIGRFAVGGGLVRRALYMAALSVIRTNTDLGRFYQGLRRRGKPGKVALVAVMRKLLLRLHAIARRGTPWVAEGVPAS